MPKAVNTQSTEPGPAKGPVDKAMEVLEALTRGAGPHRLADIARSTGLSKPTAHRHLRTLAEYGFVDAAAGGAYRVGPRLLGLAAAALDTGRDLRLARPALADLRQRTGQLAYYAVLDADEAVYLEVSEPAREYRMRVRPGGRVPLHRSGAGLAMLSALPDQRAEEFLTAGPRAAGAARGTDPRVLREAVREAARVGYAVDDEYDEPDVRSVAAPVLGGDGRVAGAIGVRGLTFTLGAEAVAMYGAMVRAAARSISADLGATGPRLTALDGTGGGEPA
ncbi:IclR family transcriptional regulator [Streptantibioticus silvisoli]|uniref:IclR family transcriptional regulator n=1 Tax=Streptantibioticus silvisoli TaxID=2705255 RepID=A0ABT6VY22_9ACTN|nr:IclR family transcriptional regulator [Streptantibioticus silvisoli]MDI5963040.1 IclR family transcriptional regulator [Streptantibioticus silvisoli]